MKLETVFAAAFAVLSASAAVKPGENLLVNGTFEADQAEFMVKKLSSCLSMSDPFMDGVALCMSVVLPWRLGGAD